MLDEAKVTQTHPTLNRCHCMPEWDWEDATYRGCTATPGTEKPWCMVVEDGRLCTAVSTSPGPRGEKRRWDYCDPEWGNRKPVWRPADERFEPKEPNPPEWYQHWYEHLMYENRKQQMAQREDAP